MLVQLVTIRKMDKLHNKAAAYLTYACFTEAIVADRKEK